MNNTEVFERMNIRVTITTNKGVHEQDFVCMAQAVKWWNNTLTDIDFLYSDYVNWLKHNNVPKDDIL